MTEDFKTMNSTVSRLLFAGLLSAFVAGCGSSSTAPSPEGYDYRQTHKIQVQREQVSVSVVVPMQGTQLAPGDQNRFKAFLRNFVQRGRSVVTVESTEVQRMREILLANGLRANEIFIALDTTVPAPNAVLSFTANQSVSPECGDWSSNPSFEYGNKPHSNFGCSTQRNIGQMVSDPGDLIQAQPATGGAASRTDQGIRIHQSGAPKARLIDGNGAAQ